MSLSIYDDNDFLWGSSTTYNANDIAKRNTYYWYCINTNTNSAPALNNVNWNGQLIDGAEQLPFFFWSPSYGHTNAHEPKIKTVQFGDSYAQVTKDGINNQMLNYDVGFDNRSAIETTAISHFLFSLEGQKPFLWIAPPPYNKTYRFRCSQWSDQGNFYDNFTIKAKFIQVPI